MHNVVIIKGELLNLMALSENNPLAFNPFFMKFSLPQYVTILVNQLP